MKRSWGWINSYSKAANLHVLLYSKPQVQMQKNVLCIWDNKRAENYSLQNTPTVTFGEMTHLHLS